MKFTILKIIAVLIGAVILFSSAAVTGQASPPAQGPSPQAIFETMHRQARGKLEIDWDEATGVPRFLRGEIPTGLSGVTDSETMARQFFHSYAGLYQMQNPDTELALEQIEQDQLGMKHVRFRQQVNGVPVWGAKMVVHTTAEDQITAINGQYVPHISIDVAPNLEMMEAVTLARDDLGDNEAEFRAERSELSIYARHQHPPTLVWKINLFSYNPLGNWLYFVDARTGDIVHRLNRLDTAKDLATYDAQNSTSLPGLLRCTESDLSCIGGDTDERAAHQNASLTYDYYLTKHGRDSYDGSGALIISSVHYSFNFNNAFWNSSQMVYGDGDGSLFIGLARELDIVAHELTHAVTENEADLIYEDESGALNESYSDVFGTLVEFDGDPGNANWLVGEDVYTPGTAGDAMRDMSDPSGGAAGLWDPTSPLTGSQPDHMSLYARLPLVLDNGGVHINSGIPNKAAYLIAQGGTFYGVTVTGIGRDDMGSIYYRTLTQYLTPDSNFMDARNGSIQACKDLFGSSSSKCTSVQNGFAAVGIGASATSQPNKIYLPLVMKDTGCSPTGIYGRVTQQGNPAGGIAVELGLCNSTGSCFTIKTTTTNSNGCYSFTGVSSLASNTAYNVRYENSSFTYNNRLYAWVADWISSYTAGEDLPGGNFDIADVVLVSPGSSNAAPLPMTFSWNIRSASEMYQWELFDPSDGNPYFSSAPEYGRSNLTLSTLPSGFSTFTLYGWDSIVFTDEGYGIPYYHNYVKFSTTSLLPEDTPTTRMTQIPARQLRDPDSLVPRQK